ncbi:Pol polyprotein, partial [Operophtera brumata]
GVSAAELTYGYNFRLPCDFFTSSSTNEQDMDFDYVSRLRASINSVKPCQPTRSHGNKRPIFIHQDLNTCEQVFLRTDAVKKPLQPTYEGPYKVLERNGKTFKLQLPERRSAVISIDRLKPAYTVNESNYDDHLPTSSVIIPHQDTSATSPPSPVSTDTSAIRSRTSSQAPSSILKTTRHGRNVKLPVRFR